MAMTLTPDAQHTGNGFRLCAGSGNLGVYAANGVVLDPRQMRLGNVEHFHAENAGAYRFEWDKTNAKLKAYTDDAVSGISAEVVDTTDLSAITFRWFAMGAY